MKCCHGSWYEIAKLWVFNFIRSPLFHANFLSMCLFTPTNGYYLSLHLAISLRFNVLCLGLHDNLLLSSNARESVSLPPSSSSPSPPRRPKLPINSQQRKNVIIVGKKSGRATKHNIHRTSTPTIWANLFPIKLSLMAWLLCAHSKIKSNKYLWCKLLPALQKWTTEPENTMNTRFSLQTTCNMYITPTPAARHVSFVITKQWTCVLFQFSSSLSRALQTDCTPGDSEKRLCLYAWMLYVTAEMNSNIALMQQAEEEKLEKSGKKKSATTEHHSIAEKKCWMSSQRVNDYYAELQLLHAGSVINHENLLVPHSTLDNVAHLLSNTHNAPGSIASLVRLRYQNIQFILVK